MKLKRFIVMTVVLLISLPVLSATAVDVIDFNKQCISGRVFEVLLGLPRDHTNSTVPRAIERFVVHNKQDLQDKAKTAYHGILLVDKFFRKELNWKSVDNKNTPIILLTNLESTPCGGDAANAFFATIGDEYARVIAVFFGHQQAYEDIANDIDMLGHEFTHGVFHATHGQRVDFEIKSINEGIGDIFGATIRAWHESGGDLAKTFIREDSFNFAKSTGRILSKYYHQSVPAISLRDNLNPDLDAPRPGAKHYALIYQESYHEVHSAGALISYAYALLVKGKTVSSHGGEVVINGIGFEKAIKIVFYALKHQFSFNTMPEFAKAIKKAARKIHGRNSPEVVSVHNAFTVVGLFDRAIAESQNEAEQEPVEPTETSESEEQVQQTEPIEPAIEEQNTVSLSSSTLLLIFSGFFAVLMFTAWLLGRRRQRQLLLQSQHHNITEIEPSLAYDNSPVSTEERHVEQRLSQGEISTQIIKEKKSTHDKSIAASVSVQGQTFALELDEQPLILGRESELDLPRKLKEIFAADIYMGREHCQLWYKASTRKLYILCQSSNNMIVDGHTLEANIKGKVDFNQTVSMTLGKTVVLISPR